MGKHSKIQICTQGSSEKDSKSLGNNIKKQQIGTCDLNILPTAQKQGRDSPQNGRTILTSKMPGKRLMSRIYKETQLSKNPHSTISKGLIK